MYFSSHFSISKIEMCLTIVCHNLIDSYNGQFYVWIGPGYKMQLFNQILIYMLLLRYFIGVIKVHNQLTLSKRNYPI